MKTIDDTLPTYNQGWIEGKKDERDAIIKLIEGRIAELKLTNSIYLINELEHLLTQLK